jgi:hypothetical protein
MAMAFVRHGCRVSAVCPEGHPLRYVSGISSLHPYKRLGSATSLKTAILSTRAELIVPCDDGVVWQLHEIYSENPELRGLIERSLGAREFFTTLQKRADLIRAAAELGIRVPLTQIVTAADDLKGWCIDAPAVLKLDGTWGGEGVVIARTPEWAAVAFHRLSKPVSVLTAWKRMLVNRDPIALWTWRRQEKSRVTVQQFIPGRPANTMFACWNGEVLAIITVEVLATQGATGAATVVRLVQDEEIERAVRLLAMRFKLSGFHGLDFILEEKSGVPHLIELNPRCTQLGHLNVLGRGNLAEALCVKLGSNLPTEPFSTALHRNVSMGSTIAFFPQALKWNPWSEYLHRGFHDVPWEELALVQELLGRSWSERRFLSRIYHFFRTPKLSEEVSFHSNPATERTQGQRYPAPLDEKSRVGRIGKKNASSN